MGSLEEIIKASDNPKSVAKYFGLFSPNLLEGETVERIEIEDTLSPKALIITNKRIVECKSKSFGSELEIKFYVFWDSVTGITGNYTSGYVDYLVRVGISSLAYNCENYPKKNANIMINWLGEVANKFKQNIQTPPAAADKPEPENDLEKKLEKFKSLFDKQLISEQEYSAKKQEIISQL